MMNLIKNGWIRYLTEVIIKSLPDVHGIDILGDKILVTDRSTGLYLDSL